MRFKIPVLIYLIFILSLTSIRANDLSELTPVEDPFEFQNEYFPLDIGNKWNLSTNGRNIIGKMNQLGSNQLEVESYVFYEIKFGDSLYYLPVYIINASSYKNDILLSTKKTFFIKTIQGLAVLESEPKDGEVKLMYMIPTNKDYDSICEDIIDNRIKRETITFQEREVEKVSIIFTLDYGYKFTISFLKGVGIYTTTNTKKINPVKEEVHSFFGLESYLVK